MTIQPVGYTALLRRNRAFRRLWYAQIVSQLGDWLDSIALYALLYRITGSAQAVGGLLVAQFLPSALVGLWAGVLIDRLPRKWVMIAADLGRALLVLPFLFVHDAGDVWIVYLCTVLKVALTTFFEPARTAAIAAVAAPEELVAANGISGATWSAVLALGGALGGLVAGALGVAAAFLLDSASFLLSAALIWRVPIHEPHLDGRVRHNPFAELADGFRYAFSQRDVLILTVTKGVWSLGAGVLLLLTIVGRTVFPLGQDAALSIGLLYAARGVGAGIGPIVAQRIGRGAPGFMRRAIGVAFIITGLGYLGLSGAPTLPLAALCVLVAHIGGSIQWVYSTTLLQMTVPPRLQGRVFGAEYALMTLATSLSNYRTGVAADAGWGPQALSLALAAAFAAPGLLMLALLWREPAPAAVAAGERVAR
jgi:MFS family permease